MGDIKVFTMSEADFTRLVESSSAQDTDSQVNFNRSTAPQSRSISGGSSSGVKASDSGGFIDSITGFIGGASEAISSEFITAVKLAYTITEENNKKIKGITEDQLEYFFDARKNLGNISVDMETGVVNMTGNTAQIIEQYESILKSASNSLLETGEDALQFSEGYGESLDPLYNFFENATAAADKFSRIMSAVGSDTPQVIKQLEEAESKRILFFSQTLDITEGDIANLLKRQYAYTGEASDEIIGQIGTTAKALSEATGVSANQVKEGILAITADVDKFGNIGVDAAGRISTSLSLLGVDFSSFNSLTDQFMNFDSAANKMGELSTLFGIQMDAMEMTYLANEDQEEFLFRMREEIMDAGIDVENMSNTRARALASQLSMSVTEMKTFLREGEMTVGQEGLESATTSAASMDALTVAGRDFGNEFARTAQTAEEAFQEKFIPGAVEARSELFRMARQAEATRGEIQKIAIPESANAMRAQTTSIKAEVEASYTLMANKTVSTMQGGFDAMSNYIVEKSSGLLTKLEEEGRKKVNDLYESSGLNREGFEITHTSPDLITILDNQNLIDIKQASQISDLEVALVDAAVDTKRIDKILAALESNQKVELKIDLDGDTIADKTYAVFLRDGKTVSVNTL